MIDFIKDFLTAPMFSFWDISIAHFLLLWCLLLLILLCLGIIGGRE